MPTNIIKQGERQEVVVAGGWTLEHDPCPTLTTCPFQRTRAMWKIRVLLSQTLSLDLEMFSN